MGRGRGNGLGECFHVSGLLKLVEWAAVFTCVMLHRIGDNGQQVFFAASDLILDSKDARYEAEVDTEILGAGAIMAFVIITPVMLLAYVLEGRENVQSTSMDCLFTFLGAATLIAAGGMSCFAWVHGADKNVSSVTRNNFSSAGALGVMTIATGALYLIDFFWVMYQKAVIGDPQDY